ncbi:DUF4160 domain-containing protein [Methylomonas koyamae]|uniref:DUF4160 domain-containing protein n=1 Tax=Methylomonas koyamae TaxID=702114 RepID=UPI000AEFA67B|nr:DUF4160 domain-containing protein [Methylomonas koyamae]
MPIISYFFGIYIRMYHDDHNPPHFHVEYQGHEALIAIETGEVLAGSLPNKALKFSSRLGYRTPKRIVNRLAICDRTQTLAANSGSR